MGSENLIKDQHNSSVVLTYRVNDHLSYGIPVLFIICRRISANKSIGVASGNDDDDDDFIGSRLPGSKITRALNFVTSTLTSRYVAITAGHPV